jgi:hypothetical protein
MTFQPASFGRDILSQSPPLPSSLKHRADYAAVVKRIEGDLVGVVACASTAANVLEADDESWHREWFSAGEASLMRVEHARNAGNGSEARNNWRRAAIYFSAAELYLAYNDPRRSATVARLDACCRGYIDSLTPAGSVVCIPTQDGGAHEAYLVRNADPTAPIVVCVGGWGESKANLIPLIQPALAWGLSVLLVEAPQHPVATRRGYDRLGMTAFLMGCVDYLEACDNAAVPIAIYGAGAGAAFASAMESFDDRVSVVSGEFAHITGLQQSAIVRSFIGSHSSAVTRNHEVAQLRRAVDIAPDMTAVDIFDQIARSIADRRG